MPGVLGRRHRLLHVRALLARWYERSTSSSTPFRFPTTTSRKVDPTVTVTWRKRGTTSTSSRITSKRNARRENSWAFTMVANEDHTHHATEEEISVYRNNWWIRSNFVGSDTMPASIELIWKKHCLLCDASRIKRIRLITKIGGKALLLILVELARFLVAFFIWATPRRWTQHWSIGETC